jgi:hypothetical protein
MALLTGLTQDGLEVPIQVKPDGKLVAEGLTGPAGAAGPAGGLGPQGPAGPAGPGMAVQFTATANLSIDVPNFLATSPTVKRITMNFINVGNNAGGAVLIQAGRNLVWSGTSYDTGTAVVKIPDGATTGVIENEGLLIAGIALGVARTGQAIFSRVQQELWVCSLIGLNRSPDYGYTGSGYLNSSVGIDSVRIVNKNPLEYFTGGLVQCIFEG